MKKVFLVLKIRILTVYLRLLTIIQTIVGIPAHLMYRIENSLFDKTTTLFKKINSLKRKKYRI